VGTPRAGKGGQIVFLTGAFKIARIFGIDIEIDYSWLIIFSLVTWTLSTGFYPINFPELSLNTNIILGTVTSIVFFASVIFHELAHSLVAKINGLEIHKITLFLFGGASQIAEEPQTAKVEFKMAAAGPLSSLFLAVLFWVVSSSFANLLPIYRLPLLFLAEINLILAIFNLVPGFPMDGGRILRSIIWHITKDFYKSTRIAAAGGKIVAFGLIAWGASRIILVGDISGTWMILIGFFLNQAASSSLQQLKIKQVLQKIEVKELMENPISIPSGSPISEGIRDYVTKFKTDNFPVTKNNQVIGIVDLNDAKSVPEDKWDETTIDKIMKPIDSSYVVSEEDKALKALSIMDAKHISKVPVINKLNKFVGLITDQGLDYYLTLELKP